MENVKAPFEVDEVVNNWRYVGIGEAMIHRGNARYYVFECLFCSRLFNCPGVSAYDIKGSKGKRDGCTHNYKYSKFIYPQLESD